MVKASNPLINECWKEFTGRYAKIYIYLRKNKPEFFCEVDPLTELGVIISNLELSIDYLNQLIEKDEPVSPHTSLKSGVREAEYHAENFYHRLYNLKEKVYLLICKAEEYPIDIGDTRLKDKVIKELQEAEEEQIMEHLNTFDELLTKKLDVRNAIVHETFPLSLSVMNSDLVKALQNKDSERWKQLVEEGLDSREYCQSYSRFFTDTFCKLCNTLGKLFEALLFSLNKSKENKQERQPTS